MMRMEGKFLENANALRIDTTPPNPPPAFLGRQLPIRKGAFEIMLSGVYFLVSKVAIFSTLTNLTPESVYLGV